MLAASLRSSIGASIVPDSQRKFKNGVSYNKGYIERYPPERPGGCPGRLLLSGSLAMVRIPSLTLAILDRPEAGEAQAQVAADYAMIGAGLRGLDAGRAIRDNGKRSVPRT